MANVINLRRARKARARQEAADGAAENRRLHGRDKASLAADRAAKTQTEREQARLDSHRRGPEDD